MNQTEPWNTYKTWFDHLKEGFTLKQRESDNPTGLNKQQRWILQ